MDHRRFVALEAGVYQLPSHSFAIEVAAPHNRSLVEMCH
jgi:hypothetical protein